jgi:hypothetical protein
VLGVSLESSFIKTLYAEKTRVGSEVATRPVKAHVPMVVKLESLEQTESPNPQ